MKRISEPLLRSYLEENRDEALETLRALCVIPAPSRHEERRSEWCRDWLLSHGVKGAYVDRAGNVIVRYPETDGSFGSGGENAGNAGALTASTLPASALTASTLPASALPAAPCLFTAHLDTVFPEGTPLEVIEKDGKWFCPGIGDDTLNAVALMYAARFLFETKPVLSRPVVLALNVCEEGLGNLDGIREIMRAFEDRFDCMVSFDLYNDRIYTEAVGSRRYEVSAETAGGHSYLNFGRRNAIEVLAGLIEELYSYEPLPGTRTTFNAGTISGGISVNTIAAHAEMLFEFRSDSAEALRHADSFLNEAVERRNLALLEAEKAALQAAADTGAANAEENTAADPAGLSGMGGRITVRVVGDRPCAENVIPEVEKSVAKRIARAVYETIGREPEEAAASTDCNIPLSRGIPSVCVGLAEGGGAHTAGEWVVPGSLITGIETALRVIDTVSDGCYWKCEYRDENTLTDEELSELRDILTECDRDFLPPLSERGGTSEARLTGGETRKDGVTAYLEGVAEQKNMLFKDNGRIIAFLSAHLPYSNEILKEFGDSCYYSTLCLRPSYRGRGIANGIYRTFLRYFDERWPEMYQTCRSWSTNGTQMHALPKFGFREYRVLKDDRGKGIDTVYYVRKPGEGDGI